jgi:hypothetical protein
MDKQLLNFLPHVIAIPLFVIISSVFFSPAYDGYDLRQGDIDQFLGMSKEIRDYRTFYDEETLWTNSMFSGMPAYQISLKQTRNVPKMFFTAVRTIFPGPVGTLFLAMISFYILGLCMRINPWLSLVGAIGFGLSSVHILYLGAGHASKVNAIALMPGVLGGVLLAFRRNIWSGAAVTALFLAMHLSANHLQMTYYLMYLIGFTAIAEIIRLVLNAQAAKALKAAGILLVAAVLAVLPNMTNILSTYEYSSFTTRGETELTITPDNAMGKEVRTEGLDRDYILEYSMSRGEFWSMMVPNIKGGQSGYIGDDRELLKGVDSRMRENVAQSNRYWGEQRFTGGAFYFGALIMALFIVALFALRDTLRWPFLLVSILAIVLSWKDASWVTDLFLNHVPLFAKFRDTKMMLVVISVVAPLMTLMLAQRAIDGFSAGQRRWFYIGSGVVGLLLLAFITMPGALFDLSSQQEKAQFQQFIIESNSDPQTVQIIESLTESLAQVRANILRTDALRSLLFAAIGLALIFLLDRKKLPVPVAIAILGIAILVDSYAVDRRYLNEDKQKGEYVHWQPLLDKRYPHQTSPASQSIYQREIQANPGVATQVKEGVETQLDELDDDYTENLNSRDREAGLEMVKSAARFGMLNLHTHHRVLNLNNPFNDARTSFFHKSIGGYHGAKLKRYQELIDFHLGPEIQSFRERAQTLGMDALRGMEIANMLNAQYLIIDPNSQAIPNAYANGHAWFVSGIEEVASANEEMEAMYTFKSKQTAVVHDDFADLIPAGIVPDSTATITLTNYEPNQLSYTASCKKEQLAVFSEIWYPEGWQAYLNGEPVEHVRANYVLRALRIPPGEHEIEFVFDPEVYHTGQSISTAGSALVLVFVLGGFFLGWRQRSTEDDSVQSDDDRD